MKTSGPDATIFSLLYGFLSTYNNEYGILENDWRIYFHFTKSKWNDAKRTG